MKKLSITKEAFEKSKYFTKKYGKLEYVSESGRLFKTNKGKVLMFNEESVDRSGRWTKILKEKYNCHWYHTNDLNVDIKWLIDNEEIGIHSGDVVSLPIKWWAQPDKESPKWNNALIDTVVYRVKDEYGIKYSKYGKDFVIADKKKFWSDNTKWQREAGKELARQYKDLTDRENRLKYSGWGMVESTRKFGRKFNESNDQEEFSYKGVVISRYDYESLPDPMAASKLDDKTMQKIAEDIYDLLVSNGWDDKTINLYLGRNLDEIEDEDNRDANMIKDDFWRFMEQAAIENGMQYYEDMSEEGEMNESKRFGKKFSKESASDIASDPAYACPYCGSHDCELDDAEDIGSGLTDGYFDGATFNAQFWCNECNKPYNVTFELKVKDVYPNEDAAMFGDD